MDYNDAFNSIAEANADVFDESESCPMGEDCSIHFRNQERFMDEEAQYGRFIDYVGEYAVVTDTNPLTPAEMMSTLFSALMGDVKGVTSDDFRTEVIRVGDGALVDTNELSDDDYKNLIVHVQTFNNFEDFETTHEFVLQGLRDGLIPRSE